MESQTNTYLPRELFISRYLSDQDSSDWRRYFVEAALRINSWENSINTNQNLDSCIDALEGSKIQEPKWGILVPSVKFLLDAATTKDVSEVIAHLLDLNNELLAGESLHQARSSDENSLVKQLYLLRRKSSYGFFAALALYDVHLSYEERTNFSTRSRALELLPIIFGRISEGFGLWALHRRWQRIFIKATQPDQYVDFLQKLQITLVDQNETAKRLIEDFRLNYPEVDFHITLDPRGPLWEYHSGYFDLDVSNAIQFQITCKELHSCYSVLSWVESLGPVQTRLARSSLFHPEANGARRLQSVIQIPDSDKYLIARIGTQQTHRLNEWGLVFDYSNSSSSGEGMSLPVLQSASEMAVYDVAGNTTILEVGSTVADFILKNHRENDAQYCIGAWINATRAQLGHELSSGDVVHLIFDRQHSEVLSKDNWYGRHTTGAAKKMASTIDKGNQAVIQRGEIRFKLMVQEYLREWGITLDEKDLQYVFNAAEIRERRDVDSFYRAFALDRIPDKSIFQLFLQFYLRGRLVLPNGEPVKLHWREIKFAHCCKPKDNEPIIGTKDFGPHNPEDPRFGIIRRLVVHGRNCKNKPSSRNEQLLNWLPKSEVKQKWGLQISLLIKDGRGLLGEIMDFIYSSTSLSIHHASADAVNFGIGKAQIVLLATAATEFELTEAKDKLSKQYDENISFKILSNRDVRQLVPDSLSTPYILSSDSVVESDTPTIMIGRLNEMNQLKGYINDSRLNHGMIVGYYRTGKTWFLKGFRATYNLPGHYSIYASYDGAPQSKSPAEIPQSMYRQIRKNLHNLDFGKNTQKPNSLNKLSDWLNMIAARNQCRFTLLLDEFSGIDLWIKHGNLSIDFLDHFVRFVRDTPSTNFIFVFQSAQYHKLIDDYSGLVDYFRSRLSEQAIEINPFTGSELRELLNEPVRGEYWLTNESVDSVHALTGGFPILCAKLGALLWQDRSNLEEVSLEKLKAKWISSLEKDENWRATIDRMIEKIPSKYQDLLRFISLNEFAETTKLWDDPGNYWVDQNKILEFLNSQTSDSEDHLLRVLKRLELSSLLSTKKDGHHDLWRISSDLLAYRLTNRQFILL